MLKEKSGDIFQWLRGFYFVATTNSFSKAAIKMGRSQSAISIQIRNLEKEFEVKLFTRSSSKVMLTDEGKNFLEKTISIFETIKELKCLNFNKNTFLKGEISIASTHMIIQYFLPDFISNFIKDYPQIKFKVIGSFNKEILSKIKRSEVDFGCCSMDKPLKNYTCLKMFETEYALITKNNEIFTVKENEIDLYQISKKPFIHFGSESNLRKFIESKFIVNGLNLNTTIEVNHIDTIKKYVGLGLGVSIVNAICLTKADEHKLKIIPLDKIFEKRAYYLIFRKVQNLSPPAINFIRLVMQNEDLFKFLQNSNEVSSAMAPISWTDR